MKQRAYRWDTGLRFRVMGLLLFLFSLVIILVSLLSMTFTNVERLQKRAEVTREHVLLMEQVVGNFAELTASTRGFLLTGQEVFIQPYGAARSRLDFALQRLIQSATDDSIQQARLMQISQLVTSWQKEIAEPEIAAKRSGLPDAGKLVSNGSGLNYIEQVRDAGQEYIKTESTRLDEEMDSANAAARTMQRMTWLGFGFASLVALAGFVVFARSVTRATGALASAAERIARGERGVVVESQLDGELQEVAEAFTAMSMTLAAQEEELQAQQEELIAQNEELQAQQDELQTHTQALVLRDSRLSRLHELGEAMIGTLEIDQLANVVLDEYLDLFNGTAGALLLAEEFGNRMTVQAERWLSTELKGKRIAISGPLSRCVETSELVVARFPDTVTHFSAWESQYPVSQEIYAPLVHTGRVLAVVVIAQAEPQAPPTEALALWSVVARQASVAIAAAQNHLEVKRALQLVQEQAAQVEELYAQLEEERDRVATQLEIYLSIVSTMQAGAWLTDTGGNLLVVNDTFRKFFGALPVDASLEDVLPQIAGALNAGDPFPEAVRLLVQGRDGSAEGTIRLKTGYVLQWSSAPVGAGGNFIGRLFTFQDVTELAELDRLKSEFVSTVSHELRTPLTSIMGYLSLVINGQVGPILPEQREFLEVVARNTTRLSMLINDLLDIQRIESGRSPLQLRPISLAGAVRQATETFRVTAEQKGLSFILDLPENSGPMVSADPDRLAQITSNLISNAVKYTPEGSVRVTVRQVGNRAALTVEDTGIGISPADQERVFEKFFRCENRYARDAGGTGLGLSIVKALVEEHGGEISLHSSPGKGSRFTVTFPELTSQLT